LLKCGSAVGRALPKIGAVNSGLRTETSYTLPADKNLAAGRKKGRVHDRKPLESEDLRDRVWAHSETEFRDEDIWHPVC